MEIEKLKEALELSKSRHADTNSILIGFTGTLLEVILSGCGDTEDEVLNLLKAAKMALDERNQLQKDPEGYLKRMAIEPNSRQTNGDIGALVIGRTVMANECLAAAVARLEKMLADQEK